MDDVNRYISSVKKLHMALLVLLLTVVYFSLIEYQRQANHRFLAMIDVLNGVQNVHYDVVDSLRPATLEDLGAVYPGAILDAVQLRDDEWSRIGQSAGMPHEGIPEGQTDDQRAIEEEFEDARIFERFSLRMAPGKVCSLAFIQGPSNQEVLLSDFFGGPQLAAVPLSKMQLINFSVHCETGRFFRLSLLYFTTLDEIGVNLIGIPSLHYPFFEEHLWDNPVLAYLDRLSEGRGTDLGDTFISIFQPDTFELKDTHFTHLPKRLQSYLYKYHEYVIISEDFIASLILKSAQQLTGRIYAVEETETALKDIYKVGVEETKIFGLKMDHLTLIRTAPLIAIVLTYLMYRRLRVIRYQTEDATEPWVLLRIDNRFDEFISWVFIATPALSVASFFILFCDTQGLGLVIFDRFITLRSLVTLSSQPLSFVATDTDYYASIVSVLTIVAMCWAVLVAKYLRDVLRHDRYIWRKYR